MDTHSLIVLKVWKTIYIIPPWSSLIGRNLRLELLTEQFDSRPLFLLGWSRFQTSIVGIEIHHVAVFIAHWNVEFCFWEVTAVSNQLHKVALEQLVTSSVVRDIFFCFVSRLFKLLAEACPSTLCHDNVTRNENSKYHTIPCADVPRTDEREYSSNYQPSGLEEVAQARATAK